MKFDRGRTAALAVALATLVLGAAAAPTAAQDSYDEPLGETALDLGKPAKKWLKRERLKLTALPEAQRDANRLTLPVVGGEVGAMARLEHAGALRIRAKRRGRDKEVTVKEVALTIAGDGGLVTARFAGEQRTLLRLSAPGSTPFNELTGEVGAQGIQATFPGATRKALAEALRRRRPPRSLGLLATRAIVARAPAEHAEPPLLTRPATAVEISAATLTWRARESWINYLHAAGPAGGTSVGNGATDGPAEVIPPSTDARVYEWDFPFATGWYDPPSGTAGVYFAGLLNFHKLVAPFNIDLDAVNPEVELTGAAARLIVRLSGRQNNADEQGRRAVAVNLGQAAVTPTVTTGPEGTTYSYTQIPALVPDGPTAWTLAEYYQPMSAWGSVTISFTVPPEAP